VTSTRSRKKPASSPGTAVIDRAAVAARNRFLDLNKWPAQTLAPATARRTSQRAMLNEETEPSARPMAKKATSTTDVNAEQTSAIRESTFPRACLLSLPCSAGMLVACRAQRNVGRSDDGYADRLRRIIAKRQRQVSVLPCDWRATRQGPNGMHDDDLRPCAQSQRAQRGEPTRPAVVTRAPRRTARTQTAPARVRQQPARDAGVAQSMPVRSRTSACREGPMPPALAITGARTASPRGPGNGAT